jgi:hypothetical protein
MSPERTTRVARWTRDPGTPGLVAADGPVAVAFDAIGWGWGGDWSSAMDYQHFWSTGR